MTETKTTNGANALTAVERAYYDASLELVKARVAYDIARRVMTRITAELRKERAAEAKAAKAGVVKLAS